MRERVKQWRQKVTSFLEKHIKPQSIQMTIALSFTVVSVISMGILGISLYNRFVNKMEDMTTQSAGAAAEPDGNQSGELSAQHAAYFRRHVLQRY